MNTPNSHDDLMMDLATAKGTTLTNCFLGSKFLNMNKPRRIVLPRADIVYFQPSYTRFCISIFEVKWTRADLLNDIRSEKWKSYLPYCHRFYFATPFVIPGNPAEIRFLSKKEIPEGAGLIQYNFEKKTWSVKISPPVRDIEISRELLMAMIFHKQRYGDREEHRRKIAKLGEMRHAYEWQMSCFGKEVSRACRFYESNRNLQNEKKG